MTSRSSGRVRKPASTSAGMAADAHEPRGAVPETAASQSLAVNSPTTRDAVTSRHHRAHCSSARSRFRGRAADCAVGSRAQTTRPKVVEVRYLSRQPATGASPRDALTAGVLVDTAHARVRRHTAEPTPVVLIGGPRSSPRFSARPCPRFSSRIKKRVPATERKRWTCAASLRSSCTRQGRREE